MPDDYVTDLQIYLYDKKENSKALNILRNMDREEKLYFDHHHLSFIHYICCSDGTVNNDIWKQFSDVLPELLELSLSKVSPHPLTIAIYKDNAEIISKLSNYVQDKLAMSNSLNPLALAIQLKKYKALKVLLENGWFLKEDEEYMSALLYKCCIKKDVKSFALMVNAFVNHRFELTRYARFFNFFIKNNIIDALDEEISSSINNRNLTIAFFKLKSLLKEKRINRTSQKELNLVFNVYLVLMAILFIYVLSKLVDVFVNIRT